MFSHWAWKELYQGTHVVDAQGVGWRICRREWSHARCVGEPWFAVYSGALQIVRQGREGLILPGAIQ